MSSHNTSLGNTKAQLARLLATENIIVEERKVATASFNLRTRKLVIPILAEGLSPEIYDLFCAHEVGHAIDTPMEKWESTLTQKKVPRSVLNILEDARIERKMKRKYPGLKASFSIGYKELVSRNFFNTQGKDINKMSFLDRLNLHFKAGPSLGIKFSKEEQSYIKKIEECETFEDIIETSGEVTTHIKEKIAERMNRNSKDGYGAETLSGDEFEDDLDSLFSDDEDLNDGEYGNPSSGDSGKVLTPEEMEALQEMLDNLPVDPNPPGPPPASEVPLPDEVSEEKKENEKGTSGTVLGEGSTFTDLPPVPVSPEDISDDMVTSTTDDAFSDLTDILAGATAPDYAWASIPTTYDLKKIVIPYSHIISRFKEEDEFNDINKMDGDTFQQDYDRIGDARLFLDFKRNSNPVISYLVKEFELRKNAAQLKRASTARSGDLNLNKIYAYQLMDDIFRRTTVLPNGKSHGLVMFVDWSGSMIDNLHYTIKQLLTLVLFCRKVNIPFEVYAFSDYYHEEKEDSPGQWGRKELPITYEESDIKLGRIRLMELFSSKMTGNELTYMANVLLKSSKSGSRYSFPHWMILNGTPLNEAIFLACDIVPAFRKMHKLEIVNTVFLTDGEGHPYHVPGTRSYSYTSKILPGLVHKKSGISVKAKGEENLQLTAVALEIFKRITGSKVIGFHLISGKREFKHILNSHFPESIKDPAYKDALIDQFRKEKALASQAIGYDEYYIIDGALDPEEDNDLELKGKTTRAMATAFTKFSSTKLTNRVVLSKFIGLISGEIKNHGKQKPNPAV